jgi:hypothetical protein
VTSWPWIVDGDAFAVASLAKKENVDMYLYFVAVALVAVHHLLLVAALLLVVVVVVTPVLVHAHVYVYVPVTAVFAVLLPDYYCLVLAWLVQEVVLVYERVHGVHGHEHVVLVQVPVQNDVLVEWREADVVAVDAMGGGSNDDVDVDFDAVDTNDDVEYFRRS